MPNNRSNTPDLEISWRTEELGPEMRRRLFEKLVPCARPGVKREGPAPSDNDPKHSERPRGPKQALK